MLHVETQSGHEKDRSTKCESNQSSVFVSTL